MLPVVPNMHDAIGNLVSRPTHPHAGGRVRRLGLSDPEPAMHPSYRRSYASVDNHFNYRPFNSNARSGQRDFAQSLEEPRSAEPQIRSAGDDNQLEVDAEQVSFFSSVVVVPKTSGLGYEVYKSPLPTRRENSVAENHLDFGNGAPAAAVHVVRASDEFALGSFRKDASSTNLAATQTQSIVTKSSRFSMNIGNPAMQKKLQNKLHEIRNRVDMFRSTRLPSGDDQAVDSRDGLRISKSKPSTPTPTRKNSVSERTSPVERLSPSKDPNNPPVAGVSPTPKEAPNKSDRTSYPPAQEKSTLSANMATASGPQLERKGSSPTFRRDEVCSFHDSLMIDPRTENGVSSQLFGIDADRTRNSKESFTRSISSGRVEERSPFMRDLFAKLKKKISPKKLNLTHSQRHSSISTRGSLSSGEHEFECSCKRYHCHRFSGVTVNNDLEARKEKRQEIILGSMNLQDSKASDSLDDPRNIFWTPALSFHPYKHGDKRVTFASLWPKYKELRDLLQNTGVQQTVLGPDSVMDVCTLACTCGPAHLLQCLVELELIRIDQVLESGSGLLHLALLAHNIEAAQYLMAAKISPKIRDNKGLTADQVCFNPTVRKQMAPRYLVNRDVSKDKILLKPSLQDKDALFRLASSPKNFVDIQKKLQTLNFNVNTECDNSGDFLLHIAVRQGLSQLPLLMALVKIQKADIELCNAAGMTPLMLAAAVGNCVLCDVLICLFGADPNKRSSLSGRSALHYAAEGNHRKTVECLIRRGADINMEDHDGLRADDVPSCAAATDDCREIIMFNRTKRLEMLSDLVKKGEVVSSQLLSSDLCVVDGDGNTLIMIAAAFNRYQTLHCLLAISRSTINAQHSRTGMTALSMAAKMGNVEAVSVLLRHKACPTIADMAGYLPLHQAVVDNHENVVDVFLDHFPDTYVGLYKAMRLCKKTSLHSKLEAAWEKRQEEIVTPKLLGCALNGDAEELFLLLDEGDNINPKSGTGNWPLYLAVENGHLEVVKLLFERGGDIRKRHPTTGATALHLAAKMGHLSIISYLLQFCRNSKTSRPGSGTAQVTVSARSPGMGQYLGRRKRLLDINAVDRDNKTALQLAAEKGFSKIVDLLLAQGATTALLDSQGNLVTCHQYEGVRIMIEASRQQHTHQVIRAIEEKSKKALPLLQDVWLPKFDHHLRNKEGSTPLMVAAETGRVPIIQFLLESAVYPEVTQYESDSSDSDSDTDSGVQDPSSTSPRDHSKNEDEFLASREGYSVSAHVPSEPKKEYFPSAFKGRGISSPDSSEFHRRRITQIVSDANRPKGQSIFHDGLISHVCAVNLTDGTNVLHHAIRGADAPHVLNLFLDLDSTPLNMQDNKGETALHFSCRLKRKKCVEMILAHPDLDLNIRTFDGHLPEEVTTSKAIQKMVEKMRSSSAELPEQTAQMLQNDISLCGSEKTGSVSGSTVNFDKVHSRYESLKKDAKCE